MSFKKTLTKKKLPQAKNSQQFLFYWNKILNECHFKNDGNFLFHMLDDFHFEIAFQIYFGLILDL